MKLARGHKRSRSLRASGLLSLSFAVTGCCPTAGKQKVCAKQPTAARGAPAVRPAAPGLEPSTRPATRAAARARPRPLPPLPRTLKAVLAAAGSDDKIYFFRFDGAGLRRTSAMTVPGGIGQFAYRNAKELFVLTENGKVLKVTGGRTVNVPLPAKKVWGKLRVKGGPGPGSGDQLMVDYSGGVWLGKCRLNLSAWEDPCTDWTWIRLVPSFKKQTKRPGRRYPVRDNGQVGRPRTLWSNSSLDSNILDNHANRRQKKYQVFIQSGVLKKHKIACLGPGGHQTIYADPEGRAVAAYFMSAHPPLYLARFAVPGRDEPSPVFHLFKACKPKPLVKDVSFTLGPKGLWVHKVTDRKWLLRYRGRIIGALPLPQPGPEDGLKSVLFRPAGP